MIFIYISIIITAILFYYIGKEVMKDKFRKELSYRIGVVKPQLTWKDNPITVMAEVMELSKTIQGLCKVEILGINVLNNAEVNDNIQHKTLIKSYIGEYFQESDIEWYDTGHRDRKNKIKAILGNK
jgi:hypothetical protein